MSSPAETQDPDDPRVGQVVSDRYLILRRLGEGGMGAVYLAEHTHMRKRVALKLLHAEMGENKEVLARFEREAQAAAHIDHPNVAAATDFGRTSDGAFFLVLEYIEGQSLRQALAAGPMPPARALHILRQMSLALSRAHDAGIVHRDLKPENVMLVHRSDDPDFVKVLDFGIAKVEATAARPETPGAPLTRMGTILGTPEYMAPEQALGEPVTPQADLYALGIILYEMLTGLHPFDVTDMMAILSFHIVAPVPMMRDRAPAFDVPEPVEAIARRLLEKDKKARPASARDLVGLIDAAAVSLGYELLRGPSSRERLSHVGGASSSPALPPVSTSPRVTDPGGGRDWSNNDSFAKTNYGELATPIEPRAGAMLPTAVGAPGVVAVGARPGAALLARLPPQAAALVDALRALPRNVKIVLATAIPVGFLLMVVLALSLSSKPTKKDPSEEPDHGAAGGVVALLRGKRAPEAKLRAAGKDIGALEALGKEFPDDAAVSRSLALAYDEAGRTSDALAIVRGLVDAKTDVSRDTEIVTLVSDVAAREKSDASEAALALLEDLGEGGVDALIEMSERKGNARLRAQKSLAKPDVKGRASEAASVLLDLRAAKDCTAKKSLLERAGKVGDERTLGILKTFQKTRGCGFAGIRDCYTCMRKDDVLDDAVGAIAARALAKPSGR